MEGKAFSIREESDVLVLNLSLDIFFHAIAFLEILLLHIQYEVEVGKEVVLFFDMTFPGLTPILKFFFWYSTDKALFFYIMSDKFLLLPNVSERIYNYGHYQVKYQHQNDNKESQIIKVSGPIIRVIQIHLVYLISNTSKASYSIGEYWRKASNHFITVYVKFLWAANKQVIC